MVLMHIPPPGWPVMSVAEAHARLTASGERFEMIEGMERGQPIRFWKNAPDSLRSVVVDAAAHGSRTFIVLDEERVSFAAFVNAVARLAQYLQDQGIGPGIRVAIAMRNLPEWPVAFFAVTALGAIAVPLNAWWSKVELSFAIADSDAAMLIADAERADLIANFAHERGMADLRLAMVDLLSRLAVVRRPLVLAHRRAPLLNAVL